MKSLGRTSWYEFEPWYVHLCTMILMFDLLSVCCCIMLQLSWCSIHNRNVWLCWCSLFYYWCLFTRFYCFNLGMITISIVMDVYVVLFVDCFILLLMIHNRNVCVCYVVLFFQIHFVLVLYCFVLLHSEVIGCLLVITVVHVHLEALSITLLRFYLWIFSNRFIKKLLFKLIMRF